jgi:hypothetical protein
MKMFRSTLVIAILSISGVSFGAVASFEDLGLPADSFHSNTPFTSNGAEFNNIFPDFGIGYWEGFAYSSKTDTTTAGSANQFSAIAGHGAGNSSTYGVGFVGFTISPVITLPAGTNPSSIDVTNTTYTYLSMRDGDQFAKKFGGASGNDPDFFVMTITGRDDSNTIVNHVDFYLADYRFADNAQDYLIHDWTTVDLSSLAGSRTLTFSLASSDTGQFGMNTPAYFALDNVSFVPEPAAMAVVMSSVFWLARWSRRENRA